MSFIGIFIAALVGLAIMALFAGLLVIFSRQDPNERLQDFIQPEFVANAEDDQATNTGSASKAVFKKLDRQLQSHGLGGKINADLLQADLKLTVTEYILLVLGVTVLGALIGFLISRQPISAFVAGTICFFGPGIIVKTRQIKRRRTFANQLVDVLTQIIGSLRSGYGLLQALDLAASQMPPPAGEEFGRVVREVQLGQPLMVALRHLAERIDNDDLVIVIAAINTSQQVGGNLAEILDTVSETIRERVRIKQEIQVLTAQQTISGYVLVFLPIALGALLMIINPTYQMRLFTPGITLCIPSGAALGIILGFILMRRIVDIEV